MNYPPLTECFLNAIDRHANPRACLYRTGNTWQAISSAELLRRVAGLSKALAVMGVQPGDRVGLLSPNRPEWHIVDFAALGIGAATVPIYFRESQDRMAYILNDSGAKIVVAAGQEQVRALAECRARLNFVEHLVAAGAEGPAEFLQYETLIGAAGADDITEYRQRAASVTSDQLATLIYTSGTTGEPKGVMLTHANLSSNALDSLRSLEYGLADLALSFLPLSHVYERIVDYAYLFRGISMAYVEQIEQVQQALVEVRPTILAAVPRLFEKTYANVMEKGHQATGMRRKLFDWAMRVAEQAVPWKAYGKPAPVSLGLAWSVADRLVYKRIRDGLGGRVHSFSSGGAPLARELAEFFWSVGVPVYQGYGLTETSPVVSTNAPGSNKVGTVGRPIANVEVRIAEDGEILVRGPNVMRGYYGKPDQTREAFTPDGWLRTGDIGRLDEDGYLEVTDRKKELLKTAAGKFVAPQPIETRLKSSPFITNAIVVGDARKFVSVLLVPNFASVAAKAHEAQLEFPSAEEMCRHPWVRNLIAGELERLTSHLAQYEKPKRFALLPEDFTVANGHLTYTMKLKRRIIEQAYRDVIEQLYSDVEEPRPQPRS